jgi:NADH-quinone oxidoreductase subunit E
MLSESESRMILATAAHYPEKRAAVCEALMIVQKSRGWVSDESVADIARALDMSVEEVDGIGTFYELIFRRPVGKHVIMVCDGVSCWIVGYETVIDYLQKKLGIGLGETTLDGRFTLLPAGCLGLCEQAPAMIIDGEIFGNLTTRRVDEALSKYEGGDGVLAAHG